MNSNYKEKIANIVTALAEYYDKKLTEIQIDMYVDDLSHLSPEQLMIAVKKYRMDPKNVFFPLPAKLIGLVADQDGRPGVEEAWAMLPKGEDASTVWTDEMRVAFGVCASLIEDDMIAARMAFKEKYEFELRKARENNIPVKWTVSLGFDKAGRESALAEAVSKNRLTLVEARRHVPELGEPKVSTPQLQIIQQTMLRMGATQE